MRIAGWWSNERSLSVLAAVVAVSIFVVSPLTRPEGVGNAVLVLTYGAILVSGIAGVAGRGRITVVLVALALASGIARLATLVESGSAAELGRKVSSAGFLTLLSAVVFQHTFRSGRVTVHRISGAVAAYLLIGLVFANVYDAIEILAPGSFRFEALDGRELAIADPMVYFSFTTLTTVGYGDVTPVTPLAQSLANAEGLIGQLFPAILIARLVALELLPGPDRSDA